MAITTVALDLDYASPGAFTGLFKRVLGASPTQYVAAQRGPIARH